MKLRLVSFLLKEYVMLCYVMLQQQADKTDGVWWCWPTPCMRFFVQYCPHQATDSTDVQWMC